MIIYRIDYQHTHAGHCVLWAGSMREARALVAAARREDRKDAKKIAKKYDEKKWKVFRECSDFKIEKVNFPLKKDELLLWLNCYLDTDKG